jgi:uncharacterized protein with ATP-grasp and redox domains
LGASDGVSENDIIQSVNQVLAQLLGGNFERLRQAADQARQILFENLSEYKGNVSFFFKVKCPVVAIHTKFPIGTHTLVQSSPQIVNFVRIQTT